MLEGVEGTLAGDGHAERLLGFLPVDDEGRAVLVDVPVEGDHEAVVDPSRELPSPIEGAGVHVIHLPGSGVRQDRPEPVLPDVLAQPAIVKLSRTTLEIGCSLPVSSAGAVPRTAKTVSVALFAFPKKPGEVTIQLLNVLLRPCTRETSFTWKTPARLVFAPWSGVFAIVGVVESSTTSPGAAAFGPGWNVGLLGSLKAALYPASRRLA